METLLTALREKQVPIAVVGLGYVGLPLACLLAKKYRVIGFDTNEKRITQLKGGVDITREVLEKEKLLQKTLEFTANPSSLKEAKLIIVAVPTPVDEYKKPDLSLVLNASRTIGKAMQPGTIVVYESTVYPGVTENECRRVLEQESRFIYNQEFFLGYSPERVNPGDKNHTIDKIIKVVSGSTKEVLNLLADVYGSVITAGIHKAPSIMTAEAAKVIENTQRDINIALVNELSQIFEKLNLDTLDVLEAAGTKWNFLNFRPGLVGGHCIGVDPYYLTHLAEGIGIHPQVIQSGRRINDNMARFVAEKTLKLIFEKKKVHLNQLKIGVLGVSFKEDVPDIRNSKVMDLVTHLESFGAETFLFDPIVDREEFHEEYRRPLLDSWDKLPKCDALIFAVKHSYFLESLTTKKIKEKVNPETSVVVDIKGALNRQEALTRKINVWRP